MTLCLSDDLDLPIKKSFVFYFRSIGFYNAAQCVVSKYKHDIVVKNKEKGRVVEWMKDSVASAVAQELRCSFYYPQKGIQSEHWLDQLKVQSSLAWHHSWREINWDFNQNELKELINNYFSNTSVELNGMKSSQLKGKLHHFNRVVQSEGLWEAIAAIVENKNDHV